MCDAFRKRSWAICQAKSLHVLIIRRRDVIYTIRAIRYNESTPKSIYKSFGRKSGTRNFSQRDVRSPRNLVEIPPRQIARPATRQGEKPRPPHPFPRRVHQGDVEVAEKRGGDFGDLQVGEMAPWAHVVSSAPLDGHRLVRRQERKKCEGSRGVHV